MVTIENVFTMLASHALGQDPTDEDALALMVLLHTHSVSLREPVVEDRPNVVAFAALTQRHVASVLASAWPNRTDGQRTVYGYWYYLFNSRTPFEVVEDVPEEWLPRLQTVRQRIESHPVVRSVRPED